jgi:pilus assembly protein Flp/PilA
MTNDLQAFLKDESVATAVEYAVFAASWGLATLAAIEVVGAKLNAVFLSIATQLAPSVFLAPGI